MTTRDTKVWYVERVRELLRHELSSEDLDLLTSDLKEQLSEVDQTEVEARLGSPVAFVEAYRVSAGIEAERGRSQSGVAAEALERWLDERRSSALGKQWLRYQEAWWLLRGWVLVLFFALIYRPQPTFRPFPVPNVNEMPTTSFAVLAVLTVGSLLLARTTKWLSGRIANVLISAFTAYVLFVAAVNT